MVRGVPFHQLPETPIEIAPVRLVPISVDSRRIDACVTAVTNMSGWSIHVHINQGAQAVIGNVQEGPVCAYCDVWCRATCAQYDDEGRPFLTWTACAYCGRTELRARKLGRQTPIPK